MFDMVYVKKRHGLTKYAFFYCILSLLGTHVGDLFVMQLSGVAGVGEGRGRARGSFVSRVNRVQPAGEYHPASL